jgi:hypothetical protein
MTKLYIQIIFTATLSLFPLICKGQYEKQNIQISPLSLIDDVTFPAIQLGYERSLSERFSWFNEAGLRYRRSFLENADTALVKGFGFRAKSEIRYYMPRAFGYEDVKTVLNGIYLAANIFYKRESHNTEISYHPGKDSTLAAYDDFGVRKNILGVNLLLGFQRKLANHFLLDIYLGAGYRVRFIKDSYLKYNKNTDALISAGGYNIRSMMNEVDLKNGTSYSLSVTMGLRLGYRF